MNIPTIDQLPTTAIGLIGFVVTASLVSHAWIIRYFMTYIEKKNANLERTSEQFTAHLKQQEESFNAERKDSEARLRECLITKK